VTHHCQSPRLRLPGVSRPRTLPLPKREDPGHRKGGDGRCPEPRRLGVNISTGTCCYRQGKVNESRGISDAQAEVRALPVPFAVSRVADGCKAGNPRGAWAGTAHPGASAGVNC
jgi:hypothetical protein